MKIDIELLQKILAILEEHGDPFIPVALIANKADELEKNEQNIAVNNTTLTDNFVCHLLHLQDQRCFINAENEYDWGYIPNINEVDIVNSLDNGVFETPHCYNARNGLSAIRITAIGRDFLKILNAKGIANEIKERIASGTLDGIKEVSTMLFKQALKKGTAYALDAVIDAD